MRKLLIGPALTGIGYAAGSYYGADAEQLVHKDPDTVHTAVEQAISDRSGTMQLEGKAIGYQTRVEDGPDGQLVMRLMFDDRQAAETHLSLTPQNGGQDTLIAVKVRADHAVLRDVLAGTSKAKLAYAPDWMLNLTMRPVLQKLAEDIEKGEAPGNPMQGFQSEAEWESSLPPEKQKQLQEWRQYDASQPTMDPNADAQRFMRGGAGDSSNGQQQ
jgi:hypothetical protein